MPTNENPTKYLIYDRKLAAICQLVANNIMLQCSMWLDIVMQKFFQFTGTPCTQDGTVPKLCIFLDIMYRLFCFFLQYGNDISLAV